MTPLRKAQINLWIAFVSIFFAIGGIVMPVPAQMLDRLPAYIQANFDAINLWGNLALVLLAVVAVFHNRAKINRLSRPAA
ncbi:hypothetical protein [Azonexus hydrophilus]|uniref:Uncharacterized protein n=1 Tax=Azonexus hydrophilus TaxID=418702 RepID=A0ABZ2XKW6_9RHOO